MSLVAKLKPHLEDIKVHKRVIDLTPTERRLNLMTALITNKSMDAKVKDKKLRELVAESQVEKALKQRGIVISLHGSGPEVKIQPHDHR